MKYLMLIYGNEQVWNSVDAEEFAKLVADVDAFNADLRESGELVDSQGLVSRPRSVRVVGDAPVVTDGPYLEAKEYVGSYFVVDVDSEQRAMEIARSYPALRYSRGLGGGLEVWPLMRPGGDDL
ncbi:YciI family protein [Saccharothrix luteola]|uniref:YciI family protein n=1 Tax=Saccharothrix luteola TaxID=2893018 RepID=UPI001E29EEAD|nr:YciI family protein [Saccharothrix luteola]MCC8244071.1 YciI family protein [Saccharothrix luteola]